MKYAGCGRGQGAAGNKTMGTYGKVHVYMFEVEEYGEEDAAR